MPSGPRSVGRATTSSPRRSGAAGSRSGAAGRSSPRTTRSPRCPIRNLATGYRHLLDETSGAHARYPVYRDVAFGLAFGGLALVTGALVIALQDTGSSAITPLAFGGAGAAVLSLIPALLASRAYNPAVQHDLDEHMFRHTEWADRTAAAAFSYNQRVATECGLGTADLPMTPEASKYFSRH